MLKKNAVAVLILCLLFTSSLIVILVHNKEFPDKTNWNTFYQWLAIFGATVCLALYKLPSTVYKKIKNIIIEDKYILISLLLLTVFSRFFLITTYPYVQVGDGLRDAGLNGLYIKQGLTKDLFGFGSYEGYGNFVPLIAYYFILIFGSQPLAYIIPSTLVGILSVIFTYFIAHVIGGRKIACVSGLLLLGSLLYLHFGRTELLIILDAFLSVLIISTTYLASISMWGYLLVGLANGLALHFYLGIRAMVVISITYLVAHNALILIKDFHHNNPRKFTVDFSRTIIGLTLLMLGMLIAVGPSINQIKKNKLGNTANSPLISKDNVFIQKNLIDKIEFLKSTYMRAFLVYFSESTTSHFPYKAPLVQFPLNWFFLAGLFYLILHKKNPQPFLLYLIVTAIFLLPIPNQVMINQLGGDHRLLSIVPYLYIITAIGLVTFINKMSFPKEASKRLLSLILLCYLVFQFGFYFYSRPSDLDYDAQGIKEYLFQKVAEYIHDDSRFSTYFILDDKKYDWGRHHQEKLDFFAYPKQAKLVDNEAFSQKLKEKPDNTQFIFLNLPETTTDFSFTANTTYCKRKILPQYHCPRNFDGSYAFYTIN